MKDNRYLIRFGSRKIHPSRIRGRGFHGSHPRPSSSSSSSSPLHGLMKRGMRAPGGERNCETGFEGTISEDCFAPFSASGNARIRLSSRGGGGGGEGRRIILPECFIVCWIDGMLLSRSSSVLLDSKGKGEREGESGRACNTFVNSVVN